MSWLDGFFECEIAPLLAGADFYLELTILDQHDTAAIEYYRHIVWKWDLGEMKYVAWDRADGCATKVSVLYSDNLETVYFTLTTAGEQLVTWAYEAPVVNLPYRPLPHHRLS